MNTVDYKNGMTVSVEGKVYKLSDLANIIISNYPTIRESNPYNSCKDSLIEITMSCDKFEQSQQMIGYMMGAIRADLRAKRHNCNKLARRVNAIHFLVAYDLL